ncbi:Fe-S cluster assembly protein HesB [Nocardioides agariphilus]|jgi:Fe-S cluster assembly iron-binding protein IscA|uniref:Fe-S cluster assembly protein HesB n=1 Tax=Nocardioides agariphilus TaxID=433664 RepID=A0A930YH92_9ACTN|nr:Fe-S cluster assembly protein HesB [Nocardioides agariphilus]MBF4766857.1 Fe-S cluster assembly protein HesB [Nocardioides agariphilus]
MELAAGDPEAESSTKEASEPMLTITPEALFVMRRVTDHPTLKPTSGLRIGRRAQRGAALEVRAVDEPRPGDTVLEECGARLYLGPEAARRVEGGELDAITDPVGRVHFVLRATA